MVDTDGNDNRPDDADPSDEDAPILHDRVDDTAAREAGTNVLHHRSPMQTVAARFCGQLEHALRPLVEPLERCTETLGGTREAPAPDLLPPLRELSDQLGQLIGKMAEQQAYVLIFGPLKSGKSTFMDAICAKYVSEVSALPAYPCLVQVSHAPDTSYVVTHYNGNSQSYDDQEQLHDAVEANHRLLMEGVRLCESQGVEFEPQQHAPNAIRRIDVRVPAGDLAQSSAVLVDTPGLYSRMKFGYDRMTRDFRNAAACAVFVVKTDNLFLDQVFDEFQELLELFSRIFLIVNLDANKRDLQPDGTLRPSIEHEDPQAVVEAFENLAMSAPVKAARDDGRLHIYPVDLLGAASRRIRAAETGSIDIVVADTPRGQADFDTLLADLTDYLNSNEYLQSFVGDSLRRATSLLETLARLLDDEGVQQLRSRVETLAEEQRTLTERGEALERLAAIDWTDAMQARREAYSEAVREQIAPLERDATAALRAAVDGWFETESSLRALLEDEVQPLLDRFRENCLRLLQETLERQVVQPTATSGVDGVERRDLETAGVDLARSARDAREGLRIGDFLPMPAATLPSEHIPVRRKLTDWLLFRGPAAVRRRIFGPSTDTDQPIDPRIKADRLGDRAAEAMRSQLESTLAPFAQRIARQLVTESFDAYVSALTEALTATIGEDRSIAGERLDSVTDAHRNATAVLERLEELRAQSEPVLPDVVRLEEAFHQTDPAELPHAAPSEEAGEPGSDFSRAPGS